MTYEEEKKQLVELLANFVWKYEFKMNAPTPYERSLLLLLELKDGAEKIIYQKWKEKKNGKK